MMKVQFFRGPRELYNIASHGSGIYFATDTKEIIQNGLSFLGDLPEELEALIGRVEAAEELLEVVNGTGEGSIQNQINTAIDEFANQLTDDGTVNTFKELVNYAAKNAGDLGELILRVDNLETNDKKQDELILELQNDLSVFKNETDMRFESTIVTLEEKMDEKITSALSWENVQ